MRFYGCLRRGPKSDPLKSLVFNGIQTIALAPILGGPIQGLAGSLAPDAAGVAGGIAGPFLPIIAAPLLLAFAGPDAAMTFLLHDLAGVSSADTARLVNAKLLPLPGNYPPYPDATQAPNGVRNALGLSDLGKFAVQVMMSRGMILDVDHMSQNSLNDTLNIATNLPGGYPLNSGHNSFRDLAFETTENHRSRDQLEAIRQLGGIMGVGWENGKAGSFTRAVGEAIPYPQFTASQVANDCAGTSKSWAQLYLYAVEKFHAKGVAFGTDADGMIQFPGPRFGPQSAYGLPDSLAAQRPDQIAAQDLGVLYTPQNCNALMTAFNGRSVDPGDDHSYRLDLGYEYSKDMARFFAALQIFYYETGNLPFGVTQSAADSELNKVKDNLSDDNFQDGLFGAYGARHIKELAFGLLDGWHGWDTGSDALDGDVGTLQQLAKAVYREKALNLPPPPEITGSAEKIRRYVDLLAVWDQYHRIFGKNAPLTRSATGNYKQWDINFEGVAHYGLIPDFLQDLNNNGLQSPDLSALFQSADAFAQMWTKCQSVSADFQPQFMNPPPPGPDGNLTITYSAGLVEALLEQSSDLRQWHPAVVSGPTTTNGIMRIAHVPVTGPAKFFRLHLP